MDTKPATDLGVVPLLVGIWPHLLAPLTFLLLFTLPPFRLRSAIYLAAFTFFFLRCFVPLSIPPEWSQLTLSFALTWMYYLGWLAKMLFYQPEHHFWRVGRPAHEAEYYTGLFNRQKLGWACQLLASPRGVGWNFQVRGLRPRSRLYGRWWFVAMQIARATALAPVSVGMSAVLARDYRALGGWWKALVLGPVEALKIWADQEAIYSVFCALFVAAGFSREEDCPPLFGNNITELDSLQEFWGQFWHQNFRVMFTDYSHFVCWYLGIRRHTQLAWIFHVWTGFIISGAVHGFAMSIEPGDANGYATFRAIFSFFLLQALGLTIESLCLDTPVRDLTLYEVGLEDEKILGRIWTLGWLLFSFYWAVESWMETDWDMLSVFVIVVPMLKRSRYSVKA